MPRAARQLEPGYCYHVVNRGDERQTVFAAPEDYGLFRDLLRKAVVRSEVNLFAYCLMPNHIHLVVMPTTKRGISRLMHWLMSTHAAIVRRESLVNGHIWQGRFKAIPVQSDTHLLNLLRYVERNPVRARLVERAEDWSWSSAAVRGAPGDEPCWLAESPVPLPPDWLALLHVEQPDADVCEILPCTDRGRPYGDSPWSVRTAETLGFNTGLRKVGRPRKNPELAPQPSRPRAAGIRASRSQRVALPEN
jgi:putative transposase